MICVFSKDYFVTQISFPTGHKRLKQELMPYRGSNYGRNKLHCKQ